MIFRPNKHDLRQLEMFITKGCSMEYARELLCLKPSEWDQWQKKPEVKNILSKRPEKSPERYTLHHPDLEGQTEEAFEVNLTKFYRFKDEYKHPTGRYKYVYKYLKEHDIRMSLETLREFIKQLKNILNGGQKGQSINMGEAWRLLNNMDTRAVLPFEPEGIKRLSTVVYFTDTEDLSTYDFDTDGRWKIDLWNKEKVHDFFLIRPIGELLNLNSGSIIYLEEYLNQAKEITEALTSEPQTSSSEKS